LNFQQFRAAHGGAAVMHPWTKLLSISRYLSGIKLGIINIFARSNRRQDVAPAMPEINKILRTTQAGVVIHVAA